MNYNFNKEGKAVNITISGKFTFTDHEKFKDLLDMILKEKEAQLDLSNLEFVDSAALGMFMILNEEAGKKNIQVSLNNSTGQVRKMFEISKFNQILNIS